MIFFAKKEQVKFTEEEYSCIKILAEQYLKTMDKEERPDAELTFVKNTLKNIQKKVENK